MSSLTYGRLLSRLRFSRHFAASLNPRRSIRTRIGLAIGSVALLLSILASLLVGYTVSEQIKVNVGQSLAELAYQMTDKLDRGMFERYRDLQILSTLNAIRALDSDLLEQRTLLEKLQSTYPDYAWIGLADNQGIVQASTGKLLEGKSVSQSPWFINGQKAPYVGDVHEALKLASLLPNPSREPLRFVDVAVPVLDLQGNPRGVLAAHLSWTWSKEVQTSLLRSLQSRNTQMFILRQDGNPLLGPPGFNAQPQAKTSSTKPLSLTSIKAAQRGLNSYSIETWSDDKTYLTGFARSSGYRNYPGLGWLVLVRQKTDVAFAPAQRLQQQIFEWNVTLGGLFAVLGWLVANRITKPMVAIAAAADRIRQGNTTVEIPVLQGQDETANLSKSLNTLVSTLTQQENDLKANNQQLQLKIRALVQAQKALRSSEERLRLALDVARMGIWDWNIQSNQVTWSHNYEILFGLTPGTFGETYEAFLEYVHPQDRQLVAEAITSCFEQKVFYSHEFRVVWSDGSVHWMAAAGQVFYDETGTTAVRIIGITIDITQRKQAAEQVKASLHEKEVLLKEIHHRVKNNMQIICSLLNLQASSLENPQTLELLQESQNRVASMALVHEQLYQSEDLARIDFAEYTQNLAANLFNSYDISLDGIALKINVEHVFLSVDAAIPCGLIITELVSNSLKYAFSPGKLGEICIELYPDNDNQLTFSVSDNGIGFPQDLNFHDTETLGLQIVTALTGQLSGTIELENKFGTKFKITFPNEIAI